MVSSSSPQRLFPMFHALARKLGAPWSYDPICTSQDTFIRLIYHPEFEDGEEEEDHELSLRDILCDSYYREGGSVIIFEVATHGVFALWTAPVQEYACTNNIDDALSISRDFIESGGSAVASFVFSIASGPPEEITDVKTPSTIAILGKYDDGLLAKLGVRLVWREQIAERNGKQPRKSGPLRHFVSNVWFFCILTSLACALLIIIPAIYYPIHNNLRDKYHSWVQYNTDGSIGPRYQLHITAENASEWTSYMQNQDEWALRIDDQALIPRRLYDDDEKHYQDWIKQRYPEMNQILQRRDYINETWLGSPAIDLVPTDDLFHFMHCVLAVKRYIKAKETGRHVCGRDIDYEHVHHCLDSLDWWAFPEGKRGDGITNSNRTFWWRTKVCFD